MHVVILAPELGPHAAASSLGGWIEAHAAALAATPEGGPAVRVTLLVPRHRPARLAAIAPRALSLGDAPPRVLVEGAERVVRAWRTSGGPGEPGAPEILWLDDTEGRYFDRPGLYGDAPGGQYADDLARWGFFARAALAVAEHLFEAPPDALLAHGSRAGLALACLAAAPERYPRLASAARALVVHSPTDDAPVTPEALALAGMHGLGAAGSRLALALSACDAVLTPSAAGAHALVVEHEGDAARAARQVPGGVTAAPGGLDSAARPASARATLAATHEITRPADKRRHGAALRATHGLSAPHEASRPLMLWCGALERASGADLFLDAADALVESGLDLLVLGAGPAALETRAQALAARHPGRVAVVTRPSAHALREALAGADLLALPAREAPRADALLRALRFGVLPVASEVGAFADALVPRPGESALGFSLGPPSAAGLLDASRRALALWRDPERWARLVSTVLTADLGWERAVEATRAALERAVLLHADRAAPRVERTEPAPGLEPAPPPTTPRGRSDGGLHLLAQGARVLWAWWESPLGPEDLPDGATLVLIRGRDGAAERVPIPASATAYGDAWLAAEPETEYWAELRAIAPGTAHESILLVSNRLRTLADTAAPEAPPAVEAASPPASPVPPDPLARARAAVVAELPTSPHAPSRA